MAYPSIKCMLIHIIWSVIRGRVRVPRRYGQPLYGTYEEEKNTDDRDLLWGEVEEVSDEEEEEDEDADAGAPEGASSQTTRVQANCWELAPRRLRCF